MSSPCDCPRGAVTARGVRAEPDPCEPLSGARASRRALLGVRGFFLLLLLAARRWTLLWIFHLMPMRRSETRLPLVGNIGSGYAESERFWVSAPSEFCFCTVLSGTAQFLSIQTFK